MPFYETIFENGQHSIAMYETDDEALQAISAHHQAAVTGQSGGPAGNPAERIKRVLVYPNHPVEYAVVVTPDEVIEAVKTATVGDMVNPMEAAAAIRDLSSPQVESGAHESNYKQEEVRELSGWETS